LKEIIRPVKGMHDYTPFDVLVWKYVEDIIKKVLHSYCYNEIRFPILEKTSLFTRGIGDVTDIIEKEMYSFKDKKNSSVTLRPEGTVGCMRSCINHGIIRNSEQKLWYLGPMFRYEKPQHGRYRQFYQLGIEVLGLIGPDIDLEIILLVEKILKTLNVSKNVQLELNSIGSYQSRVRYKKVLFSYFKKYESCLDRDCQRRLYINPIRILDSKNDNVMSIIKNAPMLIDFLDKDSLIHFENLCKLISDMGVAYTINYRLVRGLDYYNRTVFEWKTNKLGSKDTICAGGRYDNLSESLGTVFTPAVGCAIGMERLILLINSSENVNIYKIIDVYIIFLEKSMQIEAIKLSENIRTELPNKRVKTNFSSGNLKKQFNKANKLKSRLVLLLGPNEISQKKKKYY